MSELRISHAWPGGRIVIPPILTAVNVRLNADRTDLGYIRGPERELEDEVAFRELMEIGFGTADNDYHDEPDVPDRLADFSENFGAFGRVGRALVFYPMPGVTAIEELVAVRTVSNQLADIQACARYVLAVKDGRSTRGVWRRESEEESMQYFVYTLNERLGNAHARLVLAEGGSTIYDEDQGRPYLADALALQVFNAWVDEEVPVKVCDKCGQKFLRQRGRAKQGQHRTVGVLYCSKSCARSVANKRHRSKGARSE